MVDVVTKKEKQQGQGLFEIIIVIAIVSTIAVGIGTLMTVGLRSNEGAKRQSAAITLAQEAVEAVVSITGSDYDAGIFYDSGYLRIYCPVSGSCPGSAKGGTINTCDATGTGSYRVVLGANNQWSLNTGSETITRDGTTYYRCVYVQNICRSNTTGKITALTSGDGSTTTCGAGDAEDPSTQRMLVRVASPNTKTQERIFYLTRLPGPDPNTAANQTDWSGGSGITGPVITFGTKFDVCNDGAACANIDVDNIDPNACTPSTEKCIVLKQ